MFATTLCAIALSFAAVDTVERTTADTIFADGGSPKIDGRVFQPHAARVRVYNGRGVLTAEWDNELYLGDSAGRPVMRWVTTGRVVPGFPNRPLSRIFQTYDAMTLKPYGYVSATASGAYLQLAISGNDVRGVKRANGSAPVEEISHTLDAAGYYLGASDIVPVAAGLETGQVIVAPLWGTGSKTSEHRVFVVQGDTTLDIEGTKVRARRVEERRRNDKSLTAVWYLLREAPYKVYGEVPLPDATAQTAMFRGGPEHRGVYASAAPSLSALVWKFRTNGRVLSSPAVSGDVVYVGSTDGSLYAINRGDGVVRWKFDTRGPVSSSPAVHRGLVFVSSVDGLVYAVDATTGKSRWTFATKGERRFTAPGIHGAIPRTERMPDPFDVFLSSPTIAGSTLYIGSGDQHVYALDVATGAKRWEFATGDVVHASPTVVDGVVYIGSWDRNLYALDAATGRERWRYTTGNDTTIYNQIGIASSATVHDGVVLVGGRDGTFHAVDARTGAKKWPHDNRGGWTIASPAVRDGIVYFPTSDGARFKALDVQTGALRFDLENNAITYSSAALAGDVAFYGTADGYLNAVDIRSGQLKATFRTDGSKENGPRYIDDQGRIRTSIMYTERTLDGIVSGFRTMMTLGSVFSSPVVHEGVVYFGSTDGHLYAVR